MYPEPEESDFPTLLNSPAPRLLCYSRESAIAEKFESMIKLGKLNSRMKDFYDIWLLSQQFDFNGAGLTEAIHLTFEQSAFALGNRGLPFQKDYLPEPIKCWQVNYLSYRNARIADLTDEIRLNLAREMFILVSVQRW